MATGIDNIGSACFIARIEVDSQNVYETRVTHKVKRIRNIFLRGLRWNTIDSTKPLPESCATMFIHISG